MLEEFNREQKKTWKGFADNDVPEEVKMWKSKGITATFTGYENDEGQSVVKAFHVEQGESFVPIVALFPFSPS
jgi:hypothetical protein